mgnify:CR=1 FL=1
MGGRPRRVGMAGGMWMGCCERGKCSPKGFGRVVRLPMELD